MGTRSSKRELSLSYNNEERPYEVMNVALWVCLHWEDMFLLDNGADLLIYYLEKKNCPTKTFCPAIFDVTAQQEKFGVGGVRVVIGGAKLCVLCAKIFQSTI